MIITEINESVMRGLQPGDVCHTVIGGKWKKGDGLELLEEPIT